LPSPSSTSRTGDGGRRDDRVTGGVRRTDMTTMAREDRCPLKVKCDETGASGRVEGDKNCYKE
jgi:hypothetical protein